VTKQNNLFILLLFFGGLFILPSLYSCKNELAEIRELLEGQEYKEVAKDVEIFYSDSAITRVRVEGPVMERRTEGNSVAEHFTEGIFAEFFDQSGERTSWVVSDRAIRDNPQQKIFLYDNVVLINVAGDTLMTEELIWDERAATIYNNRFFRFSNEKEEIYGFRFTSNQEFTEYSFSRGAGLLDPEMFTQ